MLPRTPARGPLVVTDNQDERRPECRAQSACGPGERRGGVTNLSWEVSGSIPLSSTKNLSAPLDEEAG
jgi:hypothetical protein